MKRRTSNILLASALIIFVASYLLLLYSGANPILALIWNVLASLDVNLALLPSSVASQPLVIVASFFDAFVFALMAVVLASLFLDFTKQINIRKRFTMSKIRRTKQHIILVPFNSFAKHLGKELAKIGHTCVFITENETEAGRLYRQNELALVGDPKTIEAFNAAGIGRAKYVITCAEDDITNALISVTAKSANIRAKIIARLNNFDNIQKLKSAGAYRMIMPEVTAGTEIGNEIAKRIRNQSE